MQFIFSTLFGYDCAQKRMAGRFILRLNKPDETSETMRSKLDLLLSQKNVGKTQNLDDRVHQQSEKVDNVLNQKNVGEFFESGSIETFKAAKNMAENDDYFDKNNPRALENFYADTEKLVLERYRGLISDNEIKANLPLYAEQIKALYQDAATQYQEKIAAKQTEVGKFLDNKNTLQHFIDTFDYRQSTRDQLKFYISGQPFWGDMPESRKKNILAGLSENFSQFYASLDSRFQAETQKRTDKAVKIMERAEKKYAREEFLEQPIEDLMAQEISELYDLLKHLPTEYHGQLKEQINHQSEIVRERFERKRAAIALKRIQSLTLNDAWLKENKYENFGDFMQLFGAEASPNQRIFFAESIWKIVERSAVDKFQQLHAEYQEKVDRIPRQDMADGWKKMQAGLKNQEKTYQNFDVFQADLIQTIFPGQEADVVQYFKNHPNFLRSVETAFDTYQTNRTETLKQQNLDFDRLMKGLTDVPLQNPALKGSVKIMAEGIKNSFNSSESLSEKKSWLNELTQKYIPRYTQALKSVDTRQTKLNNRLGKLKNSQAAQALSASLPKVMAEFQNTWGRFDKDFRGPQDLDGALAKQENILAGIEKDWDKKLKDVRDQIKKMSLSDIKDLHDPKKQKALKANISAFAKEFNVWTDADVWSEVKDEFGQKMLQLHNQLKTDETTEAKNLAAGIKGLKDIENMDIQDANTFNLEDENLTDFATFRKACNVQMPDDLWRSKGKKLFDTKALALHRMFMLQRRNHYRQKIKTLSFSADIKPQTELVDLRAFRCHPDLSISVTQSEWQDWGKSLFDQRIDGLYQNFRSERQALYTKEINAFSLSDLPASALKDPANLDIKNFRQQFDVWMSDEEWRQFGKTVFDAQVGKLFQAFLLSQKEEKETPLSPEAQTAVKVIESLNVDELDNTRVYTDFTEFKRQPFFQKNISFPDNVWTEVADRFQIKAAALFAEHQEKMSPMNRLKELGKKYNLQRMENVPVNSVQGFEQKLVQLERLLKKNPLSVKRFLENNERQRLPFLLDMLGEMHVGDLDQLMIDLPSSQIMTPESFATFLFGTPRRQTIVSNAIQKNSTNWYWFTTKSEDLPLTKDGKIREVDLLTDDQLAAPDLDKNSRRSLETLDTELASNKDTFTEMEVFPEDPLETNTDEPDLLGEDTTDQTLEAVDEKIDEENDQVEENLDEGESSDLDSNPDLETDNDELSDELTETERDLVETATEDLMTANEDSESDSDEVEPSKRRKNQTSVDRLNPLVDDNDETENSEPIDTTSFKQSKLETEGEDLLEHREDGNEDSLPADWADEIQDENGQYSAENFGELYVQQGMRLELILKRVDSYLSLITDNNIVIEIIMTDLIKKSYLKKPKTLFQNLLDFIVNQDLSTLKNITFQGEMITPETVSVKCAIEKEFGLARKTFFALLLED